jgi:hypothetical protein
MQARSTVVPLGMTWRVGSSFAALSMTWRGSQSAY